MLKFADIFNKEANFNPMQFIRKSSYILTPKTPLKGRVGGPEARMSTVILHAKNILGQCAHILMATILFDRCGRCNCRDLGFDDRQTDCWFCNQCCQGPNQFPPVLR